MQCVIIRWYRVHIVAAQSLGSERCQMCRVGQNATYAPYTTVYLVISLPKTPYIHRIYIYIYIYMVLANLRMCNAKSGRKAHQLTQGQVWRFRQRNLEIAGQLQG